MAGILHAPFIGAADGGLDAWTVLLLHCDGTEGSTSFVDATGRHTMTAVNNARLAPSGKFGGMAAYLDGTDDRITSADSDDWDFGSGDFTIDLWFWAAALSASVPGTLITQRNAFVDTGPFYLAAWSAGLRVSFAAAGGSAWFVDADFGGALATAQWIHVALIRHGSSFYVAKNGVLTLIATNTSALRTSSSNLNIGCTGTDGDFSGYMSEIRVSKGVARWTANFTPPIRRYC